MTRDPIFARQGWYPLDPGMLQHSLEDYVKSDSPPAPAVGVLTPHAGYPFSGPVAGRAYAQVEVPESAVVFAVNHRPRPGSPAFSLWSGGPWETPMDTLEIDETLRDALAESGVFTLDESAHEIEHSGELQLPFLAFRNPKVKINVICVSDHSLENLLAAGNAVADAALSTGRKILVVGSGDFSHESSQTADFNRSQDEKAFPFIEKVDASGFHKTVSKNNITTCGLGTFTATLAACAGMGAQKAELAAYGSSARSPGIQDYVVSYAGFVIR